MNITYFKVDYFLVQDFSCVMMHDENTCKLTGEAVCGWCFEWHSMNPGPLSNVWLVDTDHCHIIQLM